MFPSLSGSSATVLLAAVTAAVALVIAVLAACSPILGRVGARQMARRPARTATIVAGLSLSTVFITAVFGLQDSFHASAVDYRTAQVGTIDEAVTGAFTAAQAGRALTRLQSDPDIAAATQLTMSVGASLTAPRSAGSPVSAYLYAVPPGFDRVYGRLADRHGHPVRVADLSAGQVLLSRAAAQRAGAGPGQRVRIGFDGISITVTVAAVLDNDPVFTSGELSQNTAVAGVIAPLASVQEAFWEHYHHRLPANTIVVHNTGAPGQHSSAVLGVLRQLFGVAPIDPAASHGTHAPTYFDTTLIHPLQPTIVNDMGGLSLLSSKNEYVASPAARQANWLQPAFTALLVGAGLLLLVLQCLLLAGERRAELGMSRAQGLQRREVAGSLVIEGSGYALASVALGVPLGALATAGELALLNRLPSLSLGPAAPFQFAAVHFRAALRWQSALDAACLSILATIVIVALAAAWTSRTTIVTAIRDLDDPPPGPARLRDLCRALWSPPSAASGQPARESPARRRERRTRATGRILAETTRRGPLLLLAGSAVLLAAATWPAPRQQGLVAVDGAGLRTVGVMLLIAGAGLLLRWAAAALPVPSRLTSRLAITAIGAGWLLYGLAAGRGFLRAVFVPDLAAAGITHTGPYSLLEILLDLLAPLAGLLIIVIRNADLPAALISAAARRVPALAPVSRPSLAHALTYRVRAGVTVTLLSTVTFLIMLLVSNDSTASTQAGAGPYTAVLTAYLTSYLSLGMIFGVLAIGIIASRAVVERRQEIGTLRAIGFSRALVRRSFALETSYLIALGLLPATGLAWWLVTRVTQRRGQHAGLPLMPVALLLAGRWLAALAATVLPSRTAARIPPAEALRCQ
jgi:hypothetical protein